MTYTPEANASLLPKERERIVEILRAVKLGDPHQDKLVKFDILAGLTLFLENYGIGDAELLELRAQVERGEL